MYDFLLAHSAEDDAAFVRPNGEEMTYGSLAAAVRAVVDGVLGQVGVVERRALGVEVADPAGFLVAAMAAFALDAVLVPLDEENRELAARARVVATVRADADALGLAPGDAARVAFAEAGSLLVEVPGQSDLLLSRAALEAAIDGVVAGLGLERGARVAVVRPLAEPAALLTQALAALRAGGAVVGLAGLPPEAVARALALRQVEVLSGPLAALEPIARAAQALSPSERPELRAVVVAVEPSAPAASLAPFAAAFPRARLHRQLSLPGAPLVSLLSERDPAFQRGALGRPLPSLDARIEGGRLTLGGRPTGLGARLDDEGYLYLLPSTLPT